MVVVENPPTLDSEGKMVRCACVRLAKGQEGTGCEAARSRCHLNGSMAVCVARRCQI